MTSKIQRVHKWWCSFNCSVADSDPNPDPDPPDPRVFDQDPLVRGMDPELDPASDPDLDPSNIKQK
jgi:hypothetical protein